MNNKSKDNINISGYKNVDTFLLHSNDDMFFILA